MHEERSWKTVDKASWPRGPWDDEPDKVQWVDPATDLDCLIVRNHWGAHCGYVGVPPGHPCHGAGYGAVEPDPDVHGCLTFADGCNEEALEGEGICHIPYPGRPDDVWWLGFDCAHYQDYQPGFPEGYSMLVNKNCTYRTIDWVRAEVTSLAGQLVNAHRVADG